MKTIKQELKETALLHTVVIGLVCAAFLTGALTSFVTSDSRAVRDATLSSSTSYPYLQ